MVSQQILATVPLKGIYAVGIIFHRIYFGFFDKWLVKTFLQLVIKQVFCPYYLCMYVCMYVFIYTQALSGCMNIFSRFIFTLRSYKPARERSIPTAWWCVSDHVQFGLQQTLVSCPESLIFISSDKQTFFQLALVFPTCLTVDEMSYAIFQQWLLCHSPIKHFHFLITGLNPRDIQCHVHLLACAFLLLFSELLGVLVFFSWSMFCRSSDSPKLGPRR